MFKKDPRSLGSTTDSNTVVALYKGRSESENIGECGERNENNLGQNMSTFTHPALLRSVLPFNLVFR